MLERLRELLDLLRSPERLSDEPARAGAQQARARLAAIVESSDDAIIAKDLNGIISDWNSSAERMFGYRSEEVVGRPIHLLLPEERYAEEEQILATLRRGERIEHFETVRVRKDRARIQVSISVSPIRDGSGRVIGAAKIARDVTSRKAMEADRERLLAQEQELRGEAERANRAKDAFLATLSHELRTPLSPIFVWVQLLREANLDEEKTQQALTTIERSARSQAQLIDDLLDVSRIVAGKLRLNAQTVELAPVVRAAVEVVRPAADAKNISIQMILDSETGRVMGDPDRLQQVVWNLASNAVKFTPKGGRVQVILERVNSHVEIAVSDTGQGIPSRFLPHVFERFQQAASGPDREHGGLGLGLAIVRHIVELHGGTVFVESPGVDQGSTFTVKLPLLIFERAAGESRRRHPTLAAEAADRSDVVLGGLRILLVDDEPDANVAVSALLAGRGAEVRAANSAAQALEILDGWKPDLVVTDIGMPHEDGYALLAQIDARRAEHGRIPVIALTAYAATEDRIRLLAAGFQMHVPKPVEPAELLAAIANVGRAIGRL